MLITREMGVIRAVADEVTVLEAGRVIEVGPVREMLTRPRAGGRRRLLAARRPELPEAFCVRLLPLPARDHDPVLCIDVYGDQARRPLLARLWKTISLPRRSWAMSSALDLLVQALWETVAMVTASETISVLVGLRR